MRLCLTALHKITLFKKHIAVLRVKLKLEMFRLAATWNHLSCN